MTSKDNEEYLSPEEAAAALGISRRTLDRYADRGEITRYRQGFSKRVVFKSVDVKALQERMAGITPDDNKS